jgi:hypothetical protein
MRERRKSDGAVVSVAIPQNQTVERGVDWETGTLQPSGLLNHAATEGRFSLRSILSSEETDESSRSSERACLSLPPEDPVQLGHVHLSIARSLFDKQVPQVERSWY